MTEQNNGSILDGMAPWEWDARTSTDLEVATNLINLIIPRYRALIDSENRASSPDLGQVRRWESLIEQAIQDRNGLHPADPAGVQTTLDHYSRLYWQEGQ